MKRALLITLALVACIASAQGLKRVVQGTAAAGAETSHTFAEWDGQEGFLGNAMMHLASADSGELCVRVTRGGVVTKVYSKTMASEQDHVAELPRDLFILSTDTLSVSNGTSALLTYSLTIRK